MQNIWWIAVHQNSTLLQLARTFREHFLTGEESLKYKLPSDIIVNDAFVRNFKYTIFNRCFKETGSRPRKAKKSGKVKFALSQYSAGQSHLRQWVKTKGQSSPAISISHRSTNRLSISVIWIHNEDRCFERAHGVLKLKRWIAIQEERVSKQSLRHRDFAPLYFPLFKFVKPYLTFHG